MTNRQNPSSRFPVAVVAALVAAVAIAFGTLIDAVAGMQAYL